MLKLISTLLLFLIIQPCIGQVKVFEPAGFVSFPSIHPDSLNKFTREKKLYDSLQVLIEEKGVDPETLPEEMLSIYYNEEYDVGSPYIVGPIGCSWYCAPEYDTMYASSVLQATGKIAYSADNAHDFNISTAWIEGAKREGIGEELTLNIRVGDTHELASIEVYNGYCKDISTWRNNNRVKELEVYVNGKSIGILNLADSYLGQRFNIGSYYPVNSKLNLKFKIKSVYKGDKYDDTAISDFVFNGKYSH